jgi:hypothetical protein
MQQDRCYSEIIAVDPNIISVTPDDNEEAKDDGSEPLFFCSIHLPATGKHLLLEETSPYLNGDYFPPGCHQPLWGC